MNLRKLKTLLWVLCLLALFGSGYVFYDIFRGREDGRFKPRSAAYFHELIKSKAEEVGAMNSGQVYYTPERYEGLWLARIDGSLPPEPVSPDDELGKSAAEKAFVLPPIGSILKVGMIVYSDDPVDRFVSLTYQEQAGQSGQVGKVRRLHISEGQALKAPYDTAPYFGKLLTITRQTATFQWGENEQVVTPGLGNDGDQNPISEWSIDEIEDPLAGLDGIPEETIELGPGMWVIGSVDRKLIEEDGQKILREDLTLRAIPPKKDGKRSMLELTHVEPGSLPARLGFASGDRIISVNGIPMVSQAAAVNWYKQNSGLPAYLVVYQRRGAVKSMTVYSKNL